MLDNQLCANKGKNKNGIMKTSGVSGMMLKIVSISAISLIDFLI